MFKKRNLELKEAMTTINFSATAMGVYSRTELIQGWRLIVLWVLTCNPVPSTFTRQFPVDAMTDRDNLFSSAVSCVQV